MTQTFKSPTRPLRTPNSLGQNPLLALGRGLLLAAGAAGAAGCSDPAGPSTAVGPGYGGSSNQSVPGLRGPGALERTDAQDPERPFFHDFGSLDYGEEVSWSATLRNTGTAPLGILGANPMCGCTRLNSFSIASADGEAIESVHDFKKRPEIAVVPPGGTITAHIDILSKHTKPNISKLALVRLRTDSDLTPFITFELHFFPKQPFIVSPASFEMPRIPTSHGGGKKVKIMVVAPGAPGQVHRILSAPESIEARLETTHFAGETIWYVHVTVAPLTPMGAIRGEIVLAVSDEDGNGEDGRLKIPVEIRVGTDTFLDPGMFTFGALPKGFEKTIPAQLIGLVPGAKVGIKEARIEGKHAEHFTVTKTVVRPDEDGRSQTWQLELTMSGDHPPGYLQSELVLVFDEPFGGGTGADANELHARISGIIRE